MTGPHVYDCHNDCVPKKKLGEYQWQEISEGEVTEGGETRQLGAFRLFVVEFIFILWLIFGLVIFLNFIITIMGNRFEATQAEVEQFVSFNRMSVARTKDTLLPTIPAPFQTILPILKFVWFGVFEPIVWILTGKIIDHQHFICDFDHWEDKQLYPVPQQQEKQQQKQDNDTTNQNNQTTNAGSKQVDLSQSDYYMNKKRASYFQLPFFIEYRDYLPSKDSIRVPDTLWKRVKLLPRVWKELRSGMFFVSHNSSNSGAANSGGDTGTPIGTAGVGETDETVQERLSSELGSRNEPIIWICAYCCATNIGFISEQRRKHKYSDIVRYYRYNDHLPPEYGFLDEDLQFLDHINPRLCNNCFRVKRWEKRHVVIEALISFYLYNLLSFFGFRLWFGLLMLTLVIVLAVIIFAIGVVIGLPMMLLYFIRKCCMCVGTRVCGKCWNSCTSCCDACCGADKMAASLQAEKMYELMNEARFDRGQSLGVRIGNGSVSRKSLAILGDIEKKELDDREQDIVNDFNSDAISLLNKYNKENQFNKEALLALNRYYNIDSSTLYANRDYEVVLYIPYPNLYKKQKTALRLLFELTSEATGFRKMREITGFNVWSKIVETTFFGDNYKSYYFSDYVFNIEELIDERICKDFETRIVLLNATYSSCQKYKSCLQRIQHTSRNKQLRNDLPVFSVKLMSARQSLQPSWQVSSSNSFESKNYYDTNKKMMAVKQTRSKYEFEFTPVIKRINETSIDPST